MILRNAVQQYTTFQYQKPETTHFLVDQNAYEYMLASVGRLSSLGVKDIALMYTNGLQMLYASIPDHV